MPWVDEGTFCIIESGLFAPPGANPCGHAANCVAFLFSTFLRRVNIVQCLECDGLAICSRGVKDPIPA